MAKNTQDESKFAKNYAAQPTVVDRFKDEVQKTIIQARNNRRAKEEQWLDDLASWACVETEGQQYVGRANIIVPEMHHQIENGVSKYLSSLFPSTEYMGVVPLKTTTRERASKIKAAVQNQFDQKNNIEVLFDVHGRQRMLFGTSPMRASFVDQSVKIFTRGKNGQPQSSMIPKFKGVRWQPVDIFRWYICPEWATVEDCFLIFEDDFVSKELLEKSKDANGKPLYLNVSEINDIGPEADDHWWVDTQRLATNNIVEACDQRRGQAFITYVHMDFDIEGSGERVPCFGVMANSGTVLRLVRNQLWLQKPPYVVGRYLKYPTRNFYGFSLPQRLRSLDSQMKDLANQTMDSLNYALNPIAIIDPALAGDPGSFVLQPGAKWWGSPQGIQFAQFPDVSGAGFQAMSQVRAMIAQFSDQSTALAPQLQGKARSATQASVVDREVSQDLRISSLSEIADVLVPMCHMTHSLLQQFQKEEDQIRIQGPQFGSWIMDTVKPEDLEGEVDFMWQGATVAEKTAVRTQQLMNFYQLAVQTSSTIPSMQGKIDIPALFRRVAEEGFNMDRLDEILIDVRSSVTVTQEVENIAIIQGQDVPVHEADDDDEHLAAIKKELETNKKLKPDEKLALLNHAEKHDLQKQAKAKLAQNQAELQAMQMSMGANNGPGGAQAPGGRPQPGGGPQQGGQPQPGQPFQIPEGTSQSALASGIRGVNPMGNG